MPPFYQGSLRAIEHHATIRISPESADVASYYILENRSKRTVTEQVEATRAGLRHLGARGVKAPKSALESGAVEQYSAPITKTMTELFAGGERTVIDVDYSCALAPAKSGAFLYTPSLRVGDDAIHQPLREYNVLFELPATASRLIYSSVPLKTRRTKRGLVCVYQGPGTRRVCASDQHQVD